MVGGWACGNVDGKSQKFILDFFLLFKEHSLEVQVPMLQEVYSKFKILPIILIDQEKNTAEEIGDAVATIAKQKNSMIIGSSDFTHYEPNDFAHKQDMALIEPILNLDLETFYEVLNAKKITACGRGSLLWLFFLRGGLQTGAWACRGNKLH